MRFDEFEQRLNQLLDERQDWESDPEMARLIRDSAEHRALAAAYLEAVDPRTLTKIDPLPRCQPPADLAARVLAELRSEPLLTLNTPSPEKRVTVRTAPDRWIASGRFVAILAVAAAVLIAVGLYVYSPQQAPDGRDMTNVEPATSINPQIPMPDAVPDSEQLAGPDGDSPAKDSPTTSPSETVIEQDLAATSSDDPTIGALAHEAADKYAELVLDTQKAMSEVAMLLPGFGTPPKNRRGGDDAVIGVNAESGDREDGWAGDVSDGLEPLTRSAVGALDFILKALPVETPPADTKVPDSSEPDSESPQSAASKS